MKTVEEIKLLVNKERELLVAIRNICEEAIKSHISKNNLENSFTDSERRIIELAPRVFDGEIEFLNSNPVEYFDIYLDEM